MSFKVSIVNLPLRGRRSDLDETQNNNLQFARIQENGKEPEVWISGIQNHYSVPLEERIISYVRRNRNRQSCFNAEFYPERIGEISGKCPIYCISDIWMLGRVYGDGAYEIHIKEDKDRRTLVHEILHLCSDIPLRHLEFNSSRDMEEAAIEVATDFLARKDRRLFHKIKRNSIQWAMNFFDLKGMTREELTKIVRWHMTKDSENFSSAEGIGKLSFYFFIDDLLESLPYETNLVD